MSTYELTPEQKIRQRYAWSQEAQRLGDVKLACLRLGISRKTFYKWKNRFAKAKGDRSALLDRSHPIRISNALLQAGCDITTIPAAIWH